MSKLRNGSKGDWHSRSVVGGIYTIGGGGSVLCSNNNNNNNIIIIIIILYFRREGTKYIRIE